MVLNSRQLLKVLKTKFCHGEARGFKNLIRGLDRVKEKDGSPRTGKNEDCACASRKRVWAWRPPGQSGAPGVSITANCESAFDWLPGKGDLVWDSAVCVCNLGMVEPKDSKFFLQLSKGRVGSTRFTEQKAKKYVFFFFL